MFEMAEAGCWNKHKTMDEMQRINIFLLSCQPGDPRSSTQAEAQKQGRRHLGAWSMLEDHQTS